MSIFGNPLPFATMRSSVFRRRTLATTGNIFKKAREPLLNGCGNPRRVPRFLKSPIPSMKYRDREIRNCLSAKTAGPAYALRCPRQFAVARPQGHLIMAVSSAAPQTLCGPAPSPLAWRNRSRNLLYKIIQWRNAIHCAWLRVPDGCKLRHLQMGKTPLRPETVPVHAKAGTGLSYDLRSTTSKHAAEAKDCSDALSFMEFRGYVRKLTLPARTSFSYNGRRSAHDGVAILLSSTGLTRQPVIGMLHKAQGLTRAHTERHIMPESWKAFEHAG